MRYIDTTAFTPPCDWANKVVKATNDYLQTQKFDSIWKDLLVPLNQILRYDANSPRKCWYSEIIMLGADGIDVDHFRPKGNVKQLTNKFAKLDASVWNQIHNIDRNGYYFLAFEWKNFRLASQHSNQGRKDGKFTKGKQDFFPLSLQNPIIATILEELENEYNCLLDPCNENDPELLKFDASGQVDASFPFGTWEYCRAKVSIEVYHLNFDLKGLTSVRLSHWSMVEREISQLNILYSMKDTFNQSGITLPNHLNEGITIQENKLIGFIDRSQEFSAVAIDCIKHHKKIHVWMDTLFSDEMLKK